jgi:cobalt-zinc-cadmium efflux system membrane fusion protein
MNPWLRAWWLTLLIGLTGTLAAVALLATEPVTDPHGHGEERAEAAAVHGGENGGHTEADQHAPARTRISPEAADRAGIRLARVEPATLVRTVALTGTVQADPARIADVRPRYAGIVRSVRSGIGDRVEAGAVMATVESNDSLQHFEVTAPIAGVVLSRNVQVGQVVGNEPLFRIVDSSEVWIQLDVFGRDLGRVNQGQDVQIETIDGYRLGGSIDWLSPLVTHGSQSIRARVVAANADGRLMPGQFVSARVVIDRIPVSLAVERQALQTLDAGEVAFVRDGEYYEARRLQLGRGDEARVEVLGGLAAGEEYVTEGSYVVKADLEKASAAHHH